MTKKQSKILVLIFGILMMSSCASKKDVLYFSDVNLKEQDQTVFSEGKIQVNDILSIVVSSSSPELASIYNTSPTTSSASNGYLVTIEGDIILPIIGKIKVKDLTLLELENLLVKKLVEENHLKNPTVTVRLTNAKFTILGEVKNPGTYTFSEQNISLLQALGYASDLTINGKRQDVLIIREEDGKRTYMTIDLTSKKWFDSPFYYIKPNDVIYVNPNGPKVKTSGHITGLTSLLAIITLSLTTILLLSK